MQKPFCLQLEAAVGANDGAALYAIAPSMSLFDGIPLLFGAAVIDGLQIFAIGKRSGFNSFYT